MKQVLGAGTLLLAAALIALPLWAAYSGRDSLVLPFVAVGMAGLCSFLAYRAAVVLRRRIDEAAERGPGVRRTNMEHRRALRDAKGRMTSDERQTMEH